MAQRCQVDFACTGWSHFVPDIIEYMSKNSDYFLKKVKELAYLVL